MIILLKKWSQYLGIPISFLYVLKNISLWLFNIISASLQLIFSPLTVISSIWMRFILKSRVSAVSKEIFSSSGVMPVLDHYYNPLTNPQKYLKKSLRLDRALPGIDWNIEGQLGLLSEFRYNDELLEFPLIKSDYAKQFYYDNGSYMSGDAEYLYNILRFIKPKNLIEIGSGNSTLMARNAIEKNMKDNISYQCNHVCIEPYEQSWLEDLPVEVVREKVEDQSLSIFEKLASGDVLFIDSSHVIRPQGDVLFEYLEILPRLAKGVIVHVHDIFSPKDYLDDWILRDGLMWNEQYLLEAFLSNNHDFEVIGALNYLAHNYTKEFSEKCPIFAQQLGREPGAFWIRRL